MDTLDLPASMHPAPGAAQALTNGLAAHTASDIATSLQARLDATMREMARLQTIVENAAGHAIVSMDEEGCITGWNEAAAAITGWPVAEMLGSPAARFLPDRSGAVRPLPAELCRVLEDGAATIERWHERRGRGRVWLNGTVVRLREQEGGARGFLAVFRDRSAARAELEQQS